MVEKFSDYEGSQFLDKEGEFVFEITSYELSESKAGNTMAVFEAKSEAGSTKLYHSLNPKARWSYNGLIKACMKLDTAEKIAAFECDYELIGRELVGKKFIGVVKCETYQKEIKRPNDDGTFTDDVKTRESFKVASYKIA